MRFIYSGPDIPNSLIQRWREGQVIFLAGAGVSVPSNMPLFEGLTLGVYKALGDSLFAILKHAKRFRRAHKRAKYLDSAISSATGRVEADLFFTGQFDRCFSALEKRLDPEVRGRVRTRNVRGAVENILSGTGFNDNHRNLLRLSLASVDPSQPPACRLVTTNFDLLFEAAWRAEFADKPMSFDARIAPRPGAHNFKGIIHLHGMLSSIPSYGAQYILSSRDFARFYLRSGVIGNYVYDLMRRYTVVLIGYSADDPPMRYLMDAIGEYATLFPDMKRPYAITDRQFTIVGSGISLDEEVWRAKEIEPILFEKSSGPNPYAPLWETLSSWAEWGRHDLGWVYERLEQNTRTRHIDANPFQLSFVQDLLSILDYDEIEQAISHLKRFGIDFGWIDTLSNALDMALARPTVGLP